MEENLDFYKALSLAVIKQAVKDYKNALRRLRRHPNDNIALLTVKECEYFFRHEMEMYSDVDGNKLIRMIKERVRLSNG